MSLNTFSTNDSNTKKLWEEKLFRDMIKESYFSKFEGSSEDSLVHVTTKLEKDQGDRIRIPLSMRLTGPGVTGGQVLETNEEKVDFYNFDLTLEQYRNAVRFKRGIDEKRAAFQIEPEARKKIQDWGTEKIDQLKFDTLFGGTPSKVFYRDSANGNPTASTSPATAQAGINATNSRLTPEFVTALKTWARTGGGRSGGQIPLRPIKWKGKDYYILLAHPDCLYDLKTNSTYQGFVRDAADRGDENPLFTGAVANIDGVIIHDHENCPISANNGAGVAWGQASLMGAQSLVWGWGKRPRIIQKDFDYENEVGYAFDMIGGCARPIFNSKDYGSMRVYLARTNISGL